MQIHSESNIKQSLAVCAQPCSQTRTDLSSYPLGKGRKMGDLKTNKQNKTQTLLLSHYGVFSCTNRYLMAVLLRIS